MPATQSVQSFCAADNILTEFTTNQAPKKTNKNNDLLEIAAKTKILVINYKRRVERLSTELAEERRKNDALEKECRTLKALVL